MSHDNVNGKVNGDLISREGLIKHFREHIYDARNAGRWESRDAWDGALADVQDAPVVDAVPVVHARWDDDCVCSACEYQNKISMKSFDGSETISVYMPTRFCPSCGAKMNLTE